MQTRMVRVGDVARLRAGYQTRRRIGGTADGSHVLLQLRDFDDDRTRIDVQGMTRIAPGAINQDQELRDGDVVFLAKGARSFAFVPRGLPRPALVASAFFIVRPADEIDADYLAWALNSNATQQQLSRYVGRGLQMPFVPRETLANLVVPLPDPKTQRMIAELDSMAAEQHRLLIRLAERKRALATAVCARAVAP